MNMLQVQGQRAKIFHLEAESSPLLLYTHARCQPGTVVRMQGHVGQQAKKRQKPRQNALARKMKITKNGPVNANRGAHPKIKFRSSEVVMSQGDHPRQRRRSPESRAPAAATALQDGSGTTAAHTHPGKGHHAKAIGARSEREDCY